MTIKLPKAYMVTDTRTGLELGIYYANTQSSARYRAYTSCNLYDEEKFHKTLKHLRVIRAPEFDTKSNDPNEFDYIRSKYPVPAKFGIKIKYGNKFGIIIGTFGSHLKCYDGKNIFLAHPTSDIQYYDSHNNIIWPVFI